MLQSIIVEMDHLKQVIKRRLNNLYLINIIKDLDLNLINCRCQTNLIKEIKKLEKIKKIDLTILIFDNLKQLI